MMYLYLVTYMGWPCCFAQTAEHGAKPLLTPVTGAVILSDRNALHLSEGTTSVTAPHRWASLKVHMRASLRMLLGHGMPQINSSTAERRNTRPSRIHSGPLTCHKLQATVK